MPLLKKNLRRAQACPSKGHTRAPYIDKHDLDKLNIPPLPPPSSVTEKATPEEEEEIQKRIKERDPKFGKITRYSKWKEAVLADIRESAKGTENFGLIRKQRKKEASSYDGKSIDGFYISTFDEHVYCSKGSGGREFRYDCEESEWNKLPWRK